MRFFLDPGLDASIRPPRYSPPNDPPPSAIKKKKKHAQAARSTPPWRRTCLMAERRSSVKRSTSSPPSPVLERPPISFTWRRQAREHVLEPCRHLEPAMRRVSRKDRGVNNETRYIVSTGTGETGASKDLVPCSRFGQALLDRTDTACPQMHPYYFFVCIKTGDS